MTVKYALIIIYSRSYASYDIQHKSMNVYKSN